MKNCSQKIKRLVGIKELHYRRVSAPELWEAMLQDKYGIAKNKCSKKHKKGICWFFAESKAVFDKQGNVCKSSRKVYNTQLHTEFGYQNVYDVHFRLVQWEMSVQQNEAETQFPQSVLLQPVKMAFCYNEYGDLATATDGRVESTFEYQYDKNGNWTTRYQIVNGKCVEIIVRQLKYHCVEERIAESDVENEPEEESRLEEVIEEVIEEEDEVDEEGSQEEENAKEQEEEEDNMETVEKDDGDTEDEEEGHLESADSIIGQKVIHSKFGIGEIVSIEEFPDKQYVHVRFGKEIKKFSYPDAFGRYLEWQK